MKIGLLTYHTVKVNNDAGVGASASFSGDFSHYQVIEVNDPRDHLEVLEAVRQVWRDLWIDHKFYSFRIYTRGEFQIQLHYDAIPPESLGEVNYYFESTRKSNRSTKNECSLFVDLKTSMETAREIIEWEEQDAQRITEPQSRKLRDATEEAA